MRNIACAGVLLLFVVSCSVDSTETNRSPAKPDTTQPTITSQDADDFARQSSSIGQQVYVPVYSHIYQQDRQKTFNLTTTLSIRNADPHRSFELTRVSYYDSEGNHIQQYLDSPKQIAPLASVSYVIEERDLRGGVGANFLVDWQSEAPVIPPVIEAVNISTSQQQGISFLSVGRVLQERSSTQTTDSQ